MAALRFATARAVFDAFPTAGEDIGTAPGEEGPWAFAEALLESPTPEDAVGFCAYVLPRREAVWWACQCVRMVPSAIAGGDEEAIVAAEDWVRTPDEERRRAALRAGMSRERRSAATWLLLAAGWAGGSMIEGEHPVAAPGHLTAKAARAAVLIGLAHAPRERPGRLRAFVDAAIRLGGDVPDPR